MKIKVSNYIAGKLVEAGINQVFTVTGGGAMHLNDALGHQEGLRCLYQHHEQACAIAAEAYARIHNKIGALCVTTGPGGTNAITGVVGGWLDSIPMLILSGQVRYDTTARWSGVGIRAMGDQEFDIVKSIDCMTKYSEMVIDLLEQFLEAGFSKETAVRMINSALIVRSDAQVFSTIDISSLDLYTGICEFLKVGASTTFIRRENWVETISSTSLPAGVFHKLEPDCPSRKLYDGDMVIMVTDGVLDALPAAHQEKLMKDIILEHDTGNPSELVAYILARVRQYREKEPADDMTVLVMGLVKY